MQGWNRNLSLLSPRVGFYYSFRARDGENGVLLAETGSPNRSSDQLLRDGFGGHDRLQSS